MPNTATIIINNEIEFTVPKGTLLSNALKFNAFENESNAKKMAKYALPKMNCGGKTICKKCFVQVQGSLSIITPIEQEHIDKNETQENIRLACFCTILGNCSVILNKKI